MDAVEEPPNQGTDNESAGSIAELRAEVLKLRHELASRQSTYYASPQAVAPMGHGRHSAGIPTIGECAEFVSEIITQREQLDFKPRLNTSSYVNVVSEPEEEAIALLGLKVNIADQTVYPASFELHNDVLNMVARLWNCPEGPDFKKQGFHAGAGTVGSTEACLLAGLALKFRWRAWYAHNHKMDRKQVRAVYPNLVMTSMFQAAWEKFFKYMDVEPRFVHPEMLKGVVSGADIVSLCDERTLGVVCVLGNHYAGQYDPIWEINNAIRKLNTDKGFQIGIHVDAASGGFIAPFQSALPAWDFRCDQVLSISASGHKFGASCCGTGWVVWRQREDLSSHIAISVSYLGGNADSYTLNFSRPATGIYVQFYKFLRLGMVGYQALCDNMMSNAKFLRDGLKRMRHNGTPRFVFLDAGDKHCLPVVAAMFNPKLKLPYDSIDFQHALGEDHWYVCGYPMSYHNIYTGETMALFCDEDAGTTMFRIVVKSNLTRDLAEHLLRTVVMTLERLDAMGKEYAKLHAAKLSHLRKASYHRHC